MKTRLHKHRSFIQRYAWSARRSAAKRIRELRHYLLMPDACETFYHTSLHIKSTGIARSTKFAYVIYTGTPGYLASAISLEQPSRSLRSSSAPLLLQPFAPSNFCKNSFSTAVPALWNRLPSSTRNTVTLTAFRSDFKTLLFNRAYTP